MGNRNGNGYGASDACLGAGDAGDYQGNGRVQSLQYGHGESGWSNGDGQPISKFVRLLLRENESQAGYGRWD